MKHYFIYRKGNDSEKPKKTPMAQRKTIKYYRYHEDYIPQKIYCLCAKYFCVPEFTAKNSELTPNTHSYK